MNCPLKTVVWRAIVYQHNLEIVFNQISCSGRAAPTELVYMGSRFEKRCDY
ncbi:hypothetical protein HOE425_333334 [Hoeflea sp. EC-HK425]|nr:hypothetical protein HOE425_333334 [Hoeflea sp. EC-HK425]